MTQTAANILRMIVKELVNSMQCEVLEKIWVMFVLTTFLWNKSASMHLGAVWFKVCNSPEMLYILY